MDRTQVSGTCDPGSIPGEGTRENVRTYVRTLKIRKLFNIVLN